MPKIKSSPVQTVRQKQTTEPKKYHKKYKNLNFFKSIQKAHQIQDSEYLLKFSSPKISKQKDSNKIIQMAKNQEKHNDIKNSKAETFYNRTNKTASDQQSTHANGLFESGQIYQNFIIKNKNSQKIYEKKKQIKQESYLGPKSIQKKQKRQSFQHLISKFKDLQRKHDSQTKQFISKTSAEQIHRLQKIHSIEKQQILQKIGTFQKTFRNNHQQKNRLQKDRLNFKNKEKNKT